MTAVLEDLDVAEVLASRDALNTPLWDGLMASYDADTVLDIGAGWPAVITAEDGDEQSDNEQPAEPQEERPADPGEEQPAEATPAQDPDTSV